MKIYKDNITIVKNTGEYMMVYVQARSIQKKVKDWTRINDKWKPLEFEWVEWLEQISDKLGISHQAISKRINNNMKRYFN